MILDIVKIFLPAILSFGIGILITPTIAHFLYTNKMWKKKAGKTGLDGKETTFFNALHKDKEVGTPRMGGIVIWASAFIVIVGIWLLTKIFPSEFLLKLDFLSRDQTWIPFSTLLLGAIIGILDDYSEVKTKGGISLRTRLLFVGIIGIAVGTWFYTKLDISSIGLPFDNELSMGLLFIPFFAAVVLATYSGGIIDGLDGLSGGIFASIFTAYAGVAFVQNQINLSAFCAMLAGSILAFLWFNVPPARFYMSETGSMALTITLAVIAFMTDSLGEGYGVMVLPIIAFPLVITSLSVIIQVASKKMRKKKIFLSAPIHHHFEAIGWPSYKVTMRFWIVGVVSALLGMIIALIG